MQIRQSAEATSIRRSAGSAASGYRLRGLLALQRFAGNGAVAAAMARNPDRQSKHVPSTLLQRVGLGALLQGAVHSGPGASRARLARVQRSLADYVRGQVTITGPPDYGGVIRAIRAAPLAERQAVFADTTLMRAVKNRFGDDYAVAIASALLQGSYRWQNPPGNDFFRFFYSHVGSGPASPASTMNCWESIIYAAYLVGAVSAAWIRRLYVQAIREPDANAAIWRLLGWSTSLPTRNPAAGREPSVGQLVFYRSGPGVPGHVALYIGGGRVMSLWNQPRGIDHVQEVAITAFSGTIYYGDAPW